MAFGSGSGTVDSPMNSQSSPSQLAGMAGGSPGPGGNPGPGGGPSGPSQALEEQLKQSIQTLRQAEMDFQDLAEQFPAAAPSLRQAMTGVRSALRQIIANPGIPEPAAPSIGG